MQDGVCVCVYILTVVQCVTEDLLCEGFITNLLIIEMIRSSYYGTEGYHSHRKPCHCFVILSQLIAVHISVT